MAVLKDRTRLTGLLADTAARSTALRAAFYLSEAAKPLRRMGLHAKKGSIAVGNCHPFLREKCPFQGTCPWKGRIFNLFRRLRAAELCEAILEGGFSTGCGRRNSVRPLPREALGLRAAELCEAILAGGFRQTAAARSAVLRAAFFLSVNGNSAGVRLRRRPGRGR